MPRERLAEPWFSFLTELDSQIEEPADFHCIGGFVVSQHYGFARETSDLDILGMIPRQVANRVIEIAGRLDPSQEIPCTHRSCRCGKLSGGLYS